MFFVIGTSYKYSPLEHIELISFTRKRAAQARAHFMHSGSMNGAIIVSTCNRVELYVSAPDMYAAFSVIREYFCSWCGMENHTVIPYLYMHSGKDALAHLFRVTAGLDSMVPGETQVLGQMKEAFQESIADGAADSALEQWFQAAFAAARQLHGRTALSSGKVSIGSVAVSLMVSVYPDIHRKKVLIIGVGKVSGLVLKYLHKAGPAVVFIANRSYDRAERLAGSIGGQAFRFDELETAVRNADVIISATASPHLIIKHALMNKIVESESDTPKKRLFVDLALPRDIDPAIGVLSGVTLYDLHGLNRVIDETLSVRKQEAQRAEPFIMKKVAKIWEQYTVSEHAQARSL
ncbi:MAG: glutamyl-tRNA reductase [Candidatus Auribacter fodinae]|jgi:glutamyl-tRNA reductase|uniref:Glutamyl-tRNA reductase n=1 Tax=Candidatus Auribacter fodinae TaxID=2093366 RepID=A0A3A4R6M4_9BACT|nr:MAG: glutamyl-tRNA reductase [Candidatus Auribacter fodinae]